MKKKLISIFLFCGLLGLALQGSSLPVIQQKDTPQEPDPIPVRSDFFLNMYVSFLLRLAHNPSLAAGIIRGDKLVWSQAYGYYVIENQKAATTQTLYLQASVSKTVTATALMQLYEQGLFSLNDDMNMYLPFSLRNPNHPEVPITIEMILSHRSSLADDNLYWIALSYIPGDLDS